MQVTFPMTSHSLMGINKKAKALISKGYKIASIGLTTTVIGSSVTYHAVVIAEKFL